MAVRIPPQAENKANNYAYERSVIFTCALGVNPTLAAQLKVWFASNTFHNFLTETRDVTVSFSATLIVVVFRKAVLNSAQG